jgi:predicted RNase H-like nuclease (RuvC/YqgF family)
MSDIEGDNLDESIDYLYDYVKENTKDVALALMDYAAQENNDYHEHHLMQIGGEKIRELEAEIEKLEAEVEGLKVTLKEAQRLWVILREEGWGNL